MSDEYFERVAKIWYAVIENEGGEKDKIRALASFAKEVSRDTRHKAFDIVGKAQRDVMNMKIEYE